MRKRRSASTRELGRPQHIRTLFLLCGVFVVLPVFEIPVIGLSVTAPLLVPVIYYVFFQTKTRWVPRYRGWILVGVAIWVGMVVSFAANGPWIEARELQAIEIAYLVRYLFWLMVFLVTAYMASDFRIQRRLPFLLGIAAVILGGLRCFEGFAFGKMSVWTETMFLPKNSYGILFSTFTPFLFPVFLGRGLLRKAFCAVGLLGILYACAINGSRGSWICIALGLAAFCFLAFVSRPSASLRLILPVGLAGLALLGILAGSTRLREEVLSRFSTFDDLEKDKSYMTRQVMNQRNLKLFALSPWFGTGPGRVREVYVPLELPLVFAAKSDADFMRRSSHNSYLGFLAEGGLVATLPLAVLLVILAVRGAWSAVALNRRGEHWALGIYAGFIGMSVHCWAMSTLTNTATWFVYGLLAATIHLASLAQKQAARGTARPQLARPRFAFAGRRPVVASSPVVTSQRSEASGQWSVVRSQ